MTCKSNLKYIFILFALFIISLLLICLVIRPSLKSIKDNNQKIIYQKQNLTELLSKGQSLAENQKNLKKIKADFDKLENVWLKAGNELGFITDLEKAAENNQLEQSISFDNDKGDKETQATKTRMIPIGINLNGGLDEFINYMREIEALDYYININQVEISSHTNQAEYKKYAQQIYNELPKDKTELSIKLIGLTFWK